MSAGPRTPKRRTRGQNEGSVYQRASDGKWVAVVNLGWQDGKRRRKYLYGATRKEVADKLTEALSKRQRGERVSYERQTVQQYLERWLEEEIVPNRTPNTVRAYRTHIDKHIVPAMGTKQLARLTPQDVQAMLVRDRQQGYSAHTTSDALVVLRSALKRAVRWDLVPRNVATLVDAPRVEPYLCNPLTPAEARVFLERVADNRLSALYQVAVRLGLRRGELCGLQWSDVDLDAGVLMVRQQAQRIDGKWALVPPKTDQSRRTIDLTPFLMGVLREHQERQLIERELAGDRWKPNPGWSLVFCTSFGAPFAVATLSDNLQRRLKEAQLAPRRLHDLRHTAVTLMIAAGVPERVIMDIMGHSRLDMTRLYGHVLPPSRRDALTRVDDLLRSSGEK